MDNMTRDLASPLLGRADRGATLGPGPCERGQKYSGSGRLGNPPAPVKSRSRRRLPRLAALAAPAATALTLPAAAPAATLRVGTSGDYAPVSHGRGAGARGFDVDLARAFAAERGDALEFLSFRWSELEADLRAGRFDVAMSGT